MTDSAGEPASGTAASDETAAGGETPASDGAAAEATDSAEEDAYSGLLGAVPYAYRASESRLFRTYVVLGGLLAVMVALLFALALVVLVGGSTSASGGTFTFSRAFFVFLMMLVVGPLVAPILSVARRHRRGGSTVPYDRAVAAGGYLFVATLFVMLVVSIPAQQQRPPTGAFGPVLATLYDLPALAGLVPPLAAVGVLLLLHRRFG